MLAPGFRATTCMSLGFDIALVRTFSLAFGLDATFAHIRALVESSAFNNTASDFVANNINIMLL